MPFLAPILASVAVTALFTGLQIVLFRVLGKLALNTSGAAQDGPVYGLSDALSALPAWILQLANWMYLDQCLVIITAALLFSATLRLFGGGNG